jgi:hypothetical protein
VLEEDLSLPMSRNTLRVRVIPGSGRAAAMTDLGHVRNRPETGRPGGPPRQSSGNPV